MELRSEISPHDHGMKLLNGGGDFKDLLNLIMPRSSYRIQRVIANFQGQSLGSLEIRYSYNCAKGANEFIVDFAIEIAIQILPILGLQAGFVLSGAVYIEIVFQLSDECL